MISIKSTCDYETFKSKGNEYFKAKDYPRAISSYSEAISVKPHEAIAYSNRAICYLNLRRYYEAIEDCDRALTLDGTLVKAYYRRAIARKELYRYGDSLKDYEKVLTLNPGFAVAKEEIMKLRKILSSDPRLDIKCSEKPERFRCAKPLQTFELRNQYFGSRAYNIP